jgi:uncharacterized protein (TIGR03067 family)
MHTRALALIASMLAVNGCSNGGVLSSYSPEEDAREMQGTWKLTSATSNGETISDNVHLTIEREKYVMHARGVDESSTFTLGIGGPHTIRVFHHENPLAAQGFYGGTLTGIYEFSGDRLRLCFDGTGREYPKRFDAGRGSRRIMYQFVRDTSR